MIDDFEWFNEMTTEGDGKATVMQCCVDYSIQQFKVSVKILKATFL